MNQQGLAAVMDRYTNDAAFRAELQRDPEGAISRAGFTLSAQELAVVRNTDWTMDHQGLKERVSKVVM